MLERMYAELKRKRIRDKGLQCFALINFLESCKLTTPVYNNVQNTLSFYRIEKLEAESKAAVEKFDEVHCLISHLPTNHSFVDTMSNTKLFSSLDHKEMVTCFVKRDSPRFAISMLIYLFIKNRSEITHLSSVREPCSPKMAKPIALFLEL
jgi:hypothetical protein